MVKDILKGAIEASSDGILISNKEGIVIYVNEAYLQITGLKFDEIMSKSLKDLVRLNIINKALSLEVIETGKIISGIHKYVTGKSALTTASPIFDEQKDLIGVVSNTRNITDLLNLRNELSESRELTIKYSQEIKRLRELTLNREDFIYQSDIMEKTIRLASKVAEYDSTVLIHGESGTGKEVLAKFIHTESPRGEEAFIKVNCAAIPKELFESELFGYMGGAFTGASKEGKPGMFELANKGTILLDEIGELPLPVQSKLLRVIQEKEVYRVGGEIPVELDVRIIAATNRDLKQDVKEGKFREDLFFRLNVIPLNIPPLRKRQDDIPKLIIYFLENLNRKYKKTVTISDNSINALKAHSWPGNVRELENLIEYLFIMNNKDEIQIEDLPTRIISQQIIGISNEDNDIEVPKLTYLLELYEKYIIKDSLVKFPSYRQAALALGVHPSTLCRKIKKYNIDYDCMKE